MTSEPLEVRVSAVFDYWDAYIGGEKIKTDRLKRHTQTDVITHKWPTLLSSIVPGILRFWFCSWSLMDSRRPSSFNFGIWRPDLSALLSNFWTSNSLMTVVNFPSAFLGPSNWWRCFFCQSSISFSATSELTDWLVTNWSPTVRQRVAKSGASMSTRTSPSCKLFLSSSQPFDENKSIIGLVLITKINASCP